MKKIEHGDKNNFAVMAESYLKNDGTDLNRQTMARLTVDTWLFGHKFQKFSDKGNIIDLSAVVNRGKFSSYTYLKFLGDTKYSSSSNEPRVDFDIVRKSMDKKIRVPILSKRLASISIEAGINAVFDTTLNLQSPESGILEGQFTPDFEIDSNFETRFDSKLWAKASVEGRLTLIKYKANAVIAATYNEAEKRIDSLIKITEHSLSALVGTLNLDASFTPDTAPSLAQAFDIPFDFVKNFIKKLEKKMSKELFKLATNSETGWTFRKNIYSSSLVEDKKLFTGTISEVSLLGENDDYLTCKIRSKKLVEQARP